jgi:hypothetical protein
MGLEIFPNARADSDGSSGDSSPWRYGGAKALEFAD